MDMVLSYGVLVAVAAVAFGLGFGTARSLHQWKLYKRRVKRGTRYLGSVLGFTAVLIVLVVMASSAYL